MMNKPGVMQKAMEELDTVVGKERLVQESDICSLNYLKSCIREAFRLHPYHAINAPRVAMEDMHHRRRRLLPDPKGQPCYRQPDRAGQEPQSLARTARVPA